MRVNNLPEISTILLYLPFAMFLVGMASFIYPIGIFYINSRMRALGVVLSSIVAALVSATLTEVAGDTSTPETIETKAPKYALEQLQLPAHTVEISSLAPKSGKQVTLSMTGYVSVGDCKSLIGKYRKTGVPDGQVVVSSIATIGALKGKSLPRCVENFDGKGIVINKVFDDFFEAPVDFSKILEKERVQKALSNVSTAIKSGDFDKARSGWNKINSNVSGRDRKKIEALALSIVKPLPGSALQKNLDGYKFLSLVNPKNLTYWEKSKAYILKKRNAKASKKKRLLGSLRKKTDKISGTTFYQHKNRPKYTNSRSTVHLYLGQSGTSFYPRMIIQYAAKDWLFVNKVTLYADGSSFPFYQGSFKRDNHTRIWEWVDVTPSTVQLGLLKRASTSKEVILRFEGQQYRKDVKLRAKDKRALKDVLAVYELVK